MRTMNISDCKIIKNMGHLVTKDRNDMRFEVRNYTFCCDLENSGDNL